MDAVTTIEKRPVHNHLGATRARIGMIIPSVNSMTEPQFNRFAPPALGVHVARARVAGEWKRPLAMMADEIATSAKLLSDVAPDLIVFHCTDTSMTQGPQGEGRILDIVREASGIEAVRIGRCPTPMLYYASTTLKTDGAVIDTCNGAACLAP